MVKKVYRGCVVYVSGRKALVDLIELGVVLFDIVMRMDWLHLCYASLDYWTCKVMLIFLNEPVIVWEGAFWCLRGRFILYLRVHRLISKGRLFGSS